MVLVVSVDGDRWRGDDGIRGTGGGGATPTWRHVGLIGWTLLRIHTAGRTTGTQHTEQVGTGV